MSVTPTPLANQLLIASPALDDPNFARSVTLICQHDGEGAMGVMVNRPSEYTLGEAPDLVDALLIGVELAGSPLPLINVLGLALGGEAEARLFLQRSEEARRGVASDLRAVLEAVS